MTVSTFYPDADVETSSVDGYAARSGVDEIWATIKAGAGNTSDDSLGSTNPGPQVAASTTNDQWAAINIAFFLFDTASLPETALSLTAVFSFVALTGSLTDNFTDSVRLVTTTPATNTAIIDADYAQAGTVAQADDVLYSNITADSATFNDMALNGTGRGNINRSGVTKFGLRNKSDADNAEPSWGSAQVSNVNIATAEEALSGDKRPKLVVTFTEVFSGVVFALGEQPVLTPTDMRPY